MNRERAIAFISHLTGHGASIVDAVLEEGLSEGHFSCVLGHQVYRVNFSPLSREIMLSHSFLGDHTTIKYFHADSFKPHQRLNEAHWEAIKEEIREGE